MTEPGVCAVWCRTIVRIAWVVNAQMPVFEVVRTSCDYVSMITITIYRFIVGLIASGSRHLMPQHEGCNIGVSP